MQMPPILDRSLKTQFCFFFFHDISSRQKKPQDKKNETQWSRKIPAQPNVQEVDMKKSHRKELFSVSLIIMHCCSYISEENKREVKMT